MSLQLATAFWLIMHIAAEALLLLMEVWQMLVTQQHCVSFQMHCNFF